MDIAPFIAIGLVASVGLLIVGRRMRRHERDLALIAARLGTAPTGAALVAATDRLAAGAATSASRLEQAMADRDFFGELISIGALRLDATGRVDLANAAAHRLLDQPAGRLQGRTVMEAVVDIRVDSLVRDARATGAASGEVTLRPGLGERTLLIRARRSPGDSIWIVLEDVTELRRLQQIRAEFIDNLNHELRTPLTTVSLLAETLTREAATVDLPARMRERIGRIEVETGHLVQMVNELLDLSRIESGGALVLRDDVDLGRLAVSSTERLRLFAERSEVTLRTDIATNLPRIVGDEDRLGQTFINLVHNAVKFSPPAGEVVVRVRRDGDALVASVADQGVGIPRADRTRIFERFYKVDRARTRAGGGGTGLGLAIARHVVELHGGRIGVESEEGRGSVFTFTIPMDRPGGVDDATARERDVASPPDGGRRVGSGAT